MLRLGSFEDMSTGFSQKATSEMDGPHLNLHWKMYLQYNTIKLENSLAST